MDNRGQLKHERPKVNNRAPSRSWHYKVDKFRDVRRIADRHSHHRRRKILREELINHGEDAIMINSTSCLQKRRSGMPNGLSNRKGSTQTKNIHNLAF